jgi:hypothetical protein
MLQPTGNVLTGWIPMSPMNDSTFRIPLVLAAVLDSVSLFQVIDALREINVVRHQ